MKSIKKTLSLVIVLCLSLTIFSACGKKDEGQTTTPKPEEKVTINYFHYSASDAESLDNTAKEFTNENSNIEVKNEMISTDYNTVLKSKDAADKLPEIFEASTAGEPALKPYIEAGKIADVSNLKVIKQLPEEFKKSITFSDGKIYMIPVSNATRGMVYNKDLFQKAGITSAPKTLDELKADVELLKKAKITPFGIAGADGWTLGSCIFQQGQEILSSKEWLDNRWDGKGTFKDNCLPVFDLIDLMKENAQPKFMETDYMTSAGLMAEGKVAMIAQGNWLMGEVAKINPDTESKLGYFAIPYTNDASQNKLYFDNSAYMVVSSKANLEAVDKYFDYLINGKGQDLFYKVTKNLNAYGITFDADPAYNDIFEYIKAGNIIGNFQYNNMPDGFWQVNATAMQEYMSGKANKEQMLDMLDKGWNDIVKK